MAKKARTGVAGHSEAFLARPWKHDEEIATEPTFSSRLPIYGVVLRDGVQQAGVEFCADDKERIAAALAGAEMRRIEAGFPAVSPEDNRAVREIAAIGLPSETYAFERCMVDDVKRAVDCGVAGVAMAIPSSPHLIELGYRWSVERSVEPRPA